MGITKPKKANDKKSEVDVEAFIAAAPDSQRTMKGVKKGNKQQISLTIAPDLLEKVDALAQKMGQSRAAVINMAIYQAVEK